jgi:hypothetical protein
MMRATGFPLQELFPWLHKFSMSRSCRVEQRRARLDKVACLLIGGFARKRQRSLKALDHFGPQSANFFQRFAGAQR